MSIFGGLWLAGEGVGSQRLITLFSLNFASTNEQFNFKICLRKQANNRFCDEASRAKKIYKTRIAVKIIESHSTKGKRRPGNQK